jgi:signal transduction histidine kinase/CheY-like chemotaxis protein
MSKIDNRERIQELIEIVMSVAHGDYSVECKLTGENDDFDALAMGLNMMIDDLRNNIDLEKQNQKFKEINAELTKAKEKAQESDRLKSAFLSNMSHEIRSPMNAIMGFSALLGRGDTPPERTKEFYSYIENAGKQLLTLIEDIIDVSKIESNQLKVRKKIYKLDELLRQVFEIVEQDTKAFANKDIRLINNCKPHPDCYLKTDQVRFKQILINLLNNALKYTEKGKVEFGYELISKAKSKVVEIYVKDTGIGIPDDLKEVVFERFRQLHLDEFHEGTGLGLSITKGLVDLLDGDIRFSSEVNKGTIFHVAFPAFESKKTVVEKKGKAVKIEQLIDLSEYVIYIAEDRLDSYLYLVEILKPYGIKIKHVENGEQLIKLIKKQVPDMVLLDMHMPVKNGYKAIEEIRKMKYSFPVIAQTAYAMADERIKIMESGCDGYISKPINSSQLIREIKKHLSNRSKDN